MFERIIVFYAKRSNGLGGVFGRQEFPYRRKYFAQHEPNSSLIISSIKNNLFNTLNKAVLKFTALSDQINFFIKFFLQINM